MAAISWKDADPNQEMYRSVLYGAFDKLGTSEDERAKEIIGQTVQCQLQEARALIDYLKSPEGNRNIKDRTLVLMRMHQYGITLDRLMKQEGKLSDHKEKIDQVMAQYDAAISANDVMRIIRVEEGELIDKRELWKEEMKVLRKSFTRSTTPKELGELKARYEKLVSRRPIAGIYDLKCANRERKVLVKIHEHTIRPWKEEMKAFIKHLEGITSVDEKVMAELAGRQASLLTRAPEGEFNDYECRDITSRVQCLLEQKLSLAISTDRARG